MSESVPVQENVVGPGPAQSTPERTLYLGTWPSRFWAWIIDFILVLLFLNIVHSIVAGLVPISPYWDFFRWGPFNIGLDSFVFFIYWTAFEGYEGRGQSIGKMIMNLKVANRDGSRIRYHTAAIESIGKSFFPLLVFDCLIGWLGMPGSRLRVFNRISNTIVIKTDYREPAGIQYIKEKE